MPVFKESKECYPLVLFTLITAGRLRLRLLFHFLDLGVRIQ
jgi:hypothetical protein